MEKSETNVAKNTHTKGDKTKKKILDTSLKLFASNGYKETTVRDIANDIGVKQSALYNHFKSKDEILQSIIEQLYTSDLTTPLKERENAIYNGRQFLISVATTFKLIGFDKKNETLLRFLMQELYKNEQIREIYLHNYYNENVKQLSEIFFSMMQAEVIKSSDPLMLANEFLSPLFFYLNQITLYKIDARSTSSLVSIFEKHADFFWGHIKSETPTRDTLF